MLGGLAACVTALVDVEPFLCYRPRLSDVKFFGVIGGRVTLLGDCLKLQTGVYAVHVRTSQRSELASMGASGRGTRVVVPDVTLIPGDYRLLLMLDGEDFATGATLTLEAHSSQAAPEPKEDRIRQTVQTNRPLPGGSVP